MRPVWKKPIFVARLYDRMDEATIRRAFDEMGITEEIQCPQAEVMSAKYGIPKREIGEYCDAHGVKIRGCQLGCFR